MKQASFTGNALLFLLMLLFPKAVFTGATQGLHIFLDLLLPTLLPFFLVTDFLLANQTDTFLFPCLCKILSPIFAVSEKGAFAIPAGFLCGYPVGAKVITDLYRKRQIPLQEAHYLLTFCNNPSPLFVMNHLVWKLLHRTDLLFPTLGSIFLSPLLYSLYARKKYICNRHPHKENLWKERPPALPLPQPKPMDSCIMDSIHSMAKIGGYVILFSAYLQIGQRLLGAMPLGWVPLAFLEITSGTVLLTQASLPLYVLYPLLLSLTVSGGGCCILQTRSILKEGHLPFLPYLKGKLLTSLLAGLLGWVYIGVCASTQAN